MNIKQIIDKILTPAEYSKIQHEKPYKYQLKNKEKELYFYGAMHSADPSHSQFKEIKELFENFKPDLVIVEAAPGPKGLSKEEFNKGIISQSSDEVIQRRGEPGFTIRLAVENEVEWFCAEQNQKEQFQYLLDHNFGKSEIQAWSLFQNIPVFNKRRGDRTFDEFAKTSIKNFLERTGWELSDSMEDIINKGIEMIGEKVDVKNDMEIQKYINPGKGNRMHELSRLSWIFRDKVIIENILSKLKEYNRIFIVYGSSHAVVQEPAIKELFNQL